MIGLDIFTPRLQGRRSRPSSPAILTVCLAVALAGCGGSDTGDTDVPADNPTTTAPSEAQTTTAPEPAPTTTPTTTPPPEDDPGPAADESTATVSIGDETYTFGATGFITERCDPDFFGGAQIILQLLDESGEPTMVNESMVFLGVVLIPDDPSSTMVEVPTYQDDREWIANSESLEVSGTAVDDWSIEGNRVQGTATFASTTGEGPVQGTFEVVCAEE